MEEYVARALGGGDYLFYWQVEPSVVFGRNQLIANEVNVDYCRSHGIAMFRRKSGGGCVYADKDNVMFSFVTDGDNVNLTFNRYMNMMVLMLRKMGVDAVATGRNDIMVDGRKVSGNAFYHLPGRSIVHGTMLFDTDMENMVRSITPPGDKLQSNGVDSVRRRVALLKDYVDVGIDGFKQHEASCTGSGDDRGNGEASENSGGKRGLPECSFCQERRQHGAKAAARYREKQRRCKERPVRFQERASVEYEKEGRRENHDIGPLEEREGCEEDHCGKADIEHTQPSVPFLRRGFLRDVCSFRKTAPEDCRYHQCEDRNG